VRVCICDWDGVLNGFEYATRMAGHRPPAPTPDGAVARLQEIEYQASFLDPDNVACLDTLISTSHASLLLSATAARYMSTAQLREVLRARGFRGTVLGRTPIPWRGQGRGRRRQNLQLPRWLEIVRWIAHSSRTVSGLVILDDDALDIGPLREWLIQTDPRSGLRPEQLEQAMETVLRPSAQRLAELVETLTSALTVVATLLLFG
jgi:hypothetical protein